MGATFWLARRDADAERDAAHVIDVDADEPARELRRAGRAVLVEHVPEQLAASGPVGDDCGRGPRSLAESRSKKLEVPGMTPPTPTMAISACRARSRTSRIWRTLSRARFSSGVVDEDRGVQLVGLATEARRQLGGQEVDIGVVAALDAAGGRDHDDVVAGLRFGRVDDLVDGLATADADDIAVAKASQQACSSLHGRWPPSPRPGHRSPWARSTASLTPKVERESVLEVDDALEGRVDLDLDEALVLGLLDEPVHLRRRTVPAPRRPATGCVPPRSRGSGRVP